MTIDDRLHQHLERQAAAITLTPADAGEAMARGRRRRTHRRVALTAVVAVAALGVTAVAVDPGGDEAPDVQSALSATVAPTTFDWTVVDPQAGLGYGTSPVSAAGALYSLSTAPGSTDAVSGQHLYRSDDGAEWTEAGLPSGMKTGALAGSGEALYALGTAPSAGGQSLVLAASTDGAQSWTNIVLPADVLELDRQYPDQIQVTAPSVAAHDADHLLAAVHVSSTPNVADQLPDYDPDTQSYVTTADGVDVYATCDDGCEAARLANDPTNPDDVKRGLEENAENPVAHYDWSELDVAPELVALVDGRTYVYATQDGTHFEPSHLPAGLDDSGIEVVATADGYRLFVSDWSKDPASTTTHVLSSTDGATFTESAPPLDGSVGSAGLLGGRAAVSVWNIDGSSDVFVEQGGGWASLDLAQAADGEATLGEVAFGPLGLAAVLWEAQGDRSTPVIVHSVDGSTVSTAPLDTDGVGTVIGLSVSADGVFVRLGDNPDGDPATPPTQHVLVGTPA